MASKPIHILCTRPVSQALVESASTSGITTDTIEFIETVAIDSKDLQQLVLQLASTKSTIVFTSMNAVDAVTAMLNDTKPEWKIFAMGNTTRQLVLDFFGANALVDTGNNATELAHKLVYWQQTNSPGGDVIFFCGDQRRDELPQILKNNSIALQEVSVYQTIETSHAIDNNYDAILFFSPSAVHSFFKNNLPPVETIFFAIGETTAGAIKTYCNNKMVVANTPAKDQLFRQCIQYFKKPGIGQHSETGHQQLKD